MVVRLLTRYVVFRLTLMLISLNVLKNFFLYVWLLKYLSLLQDK